MQVGNETAMLFVDKSVTDHTQLIWLAWAAVIAGLYFPGKSKCFIAVLYFPGKSKCFIAVLYFLGEANCSLFFIFPVNALYCRVFLRNFRC